MKKNKDLLFHQALARRCGDDSGLYTLETGFLGERIFYDLLEKYAPDHWKIYHDLNFESDKNRIQVDFLAFDGQEAFHFEVKHYLSQVLVTNDGFYFNGKFSENNPVRQVQRAQDFLKARFDLPIHSYLVFINPERQPDIQADLPIDFLFHHQVASFLEKLHEPAWPEPSLFDAFEKKMQNFLVADRHYSKLSESDYHRIQRLCLCPECGRRITHFTDRSGHCSCGKKTSKFQLTLDAVSDALILNAGQAASSDYIRLFIDEEVIHKATLYRVLKKEFDRVNPSKPYFYVEKKAN